ncbi:hypothetical protein LTR78_007304 [Recurvomyces mirabilis]|uniref:Uncharacterized protein n=1 Tax=Recurvomyces mirabilis TaxID=574656 RepID=A0AAE0TS13_9PEZI|nr:hypothetical protein LTR78_007304 [Recurvomyces mirabilis]KAK5155107.1 hypothetical protein LTS14_006062 [Recurvomyces mirabilis]
MSKLPQRVPAPRQKLNLVCNAFTLTANHTKHNKEHAGIVELNQHYINMASPKNIRVCHILQLPPELRNAIFETAYTVTPAEKRPLFQRDGLSWELLLTCRQIYKEALGIREQAHHTYWSQKALVADKVLVGTTVPQLGLLRNKDITSITSIWLAHDEFGERTVFDRGVWQNETGEC